MLHTIIDLAVKIAAGVVASLVAIYTPALLRLIRERVKNATAREALAFVTSVVASQVAARAEEARTLKGGGGKLSSADAHRLLEAAIADAKRTAPGQVEVLRRGLAAGQSVDEVLRALTEAQVEELRRRPAGLNLPAVNIAVSAPPEGLPRPTVEPPAPIAPAGGSQ